MFITIKIRLLHRGKALKKKIILPALLGIALTSSSLAFAGEPTELVIHKFRYEGGQSLTDSSVDFQPWTGEPVAYTLYQLDPSTIGSRSEKDILKELNLDWERGIQDFHLKPVRTNSYVGSDGKAYMEKLTPGCYVLEESIYPKEAKYQSCRWFFWLNGDKDSVDIYMKNTGRKLEFSHLHNGGGSDHGGSGHDENNPDGGGNHNGTTNNGSGNNENPNNDPSHGDQNPPVSPSVSPYDMSTGNDFGNNNHGSHNGEDENGEHGKNSHDKKNKNGATIHHELENDASPVSDGAYHQGGSESSKPVKSRSWKKPQHVRISKTGDIANVAGYGIVGLVAGLIGLARKKMKKDD